MSFVNLNCANFGLTNPVTVTLDGNGVAIAVKYTLTQQTAKIPAAATAAPGKANAPGRGHREQNPSGE